MRRIVNCLLSVCMILGLCACGQKADVKVPSNVSSWQEQYDLGVRYLSEGNFEEAIIAFTAAIEIDSKQADAYLALAEVYITQNDFDGALAVLQEGLARTQKEQVFLDMINMMNLRGKISVTGDDGAINISLKYSGLPSEVYVSQKNDGVDAMIMVYFSDGQQIWRVWTEAHDSSGGDGGYMVSIPSEMTLSKLQRQYPWEPGPDFESVSTTRNEETITWNLAIPESVLSISNIKYLSYHVYFYISEEDYLAHENRGVANWEDATFAIENGVQKYLGYTTIDEILGL